LHGVKVVRLALQVSSISGSSSDEEEEQSSTQQDGGRVPGSLPQQQFIAAGASGAKHCAGMGMHARGHQCHPSACRVETSPERRNITFTHSLTNLSQMGGA
jgi:hypothetical protein